MFQDLSKIKDEGFVGFNTIAQLWNDQTSIPNERGIYVILNSDNSKKQFLAKGSGGYFKGKEPNITLSELDKNWVLNSSVLYIGKAGGVSSSATLRKRLKQYLDFGKGKAVGHYGGRLIWQLSHHAELLVAWKVTNENEPRLEEEKLIREFVDYYGKFPFANLKF